MPLIDGPTTFTAMKEAIDTATDNTHFIYLLAWWCDPWVNLTDPGTSLLDLFDAAGRKGVQIRVLLWNAPAAVPGFPNHSRLHDAAETALNRIPNCFAQQDDAGLTRSHHQKLLVVKGNKGLISFCGGIDVNADRRYPLPPPAGSYRSDRPRNISWVGASGSSAGSPTGSPLHDVHARVDGPRGIVAAAVVPLALVVSLREPRHRPPRSAARPVERIDLRPGRPVRTRGAHVQRSRAAPGRPDPRAGTRGPGARHLVAGDPRCAPLHLHRGAVPHEPVWRRGDSLCAAKGAARHDPDPAIGDHGSQRRVAAATRVHRSHHAGQPAREEAPRVHARRQGMRAGRTAHLCALEDGGDRRRPAADRLRQLQPSADGRPTPSSSSRRSNT